MKSFFQKIKLKYIILIVLYLLIASYVSTMYCLNLDNNIVIYSVFFLLLIVLNRLIYMFDKKNVSKLRKYILYISEALFFLYLLLIFFYGAEYLVRYKILIIPSILLGVFQTIKLKRQKNEIV